MLVRLLTIASLAQSWNSLHLCMCSCVLLLFRRPAYGMLSCPLSSMRGASSCFVASLGTQESGGLNSCFIAVVDCPYIFDMRIGDSPPGVAPSATRDRPHERKEDQRTEETMEWASAKDRFASRLKSPPPMHCPPEETNALQTAAARSFFFGVALLKRIQI